MTPDTSLRVSPVPRLALSMEETAQAVGLCSKAGAPGRDSGRVVKHGHSEENRVRRTPIETKNEPPSTSVSRTLAARCKW